MNAILALCHFCDSHGPCILFCTQAFHSSYDAQLLHDSAPDPVDDNVSLLPRQQRSQSVVDEDKASVSSLTMNNSLTLSLPSDEPKAQTSTCEACCFLPKGKPGFITVDHKAEIHYISSQYPKEHHLYSVVKQACYRSLSCEVCPGREGPMIYGEDQGCHVLSHTFFLKDSKGRGSRRWYSIIIVMLDRVFLANSWGFLVSHFKAVIAELQAKADKVYQEERGNHDASSKQYLPPPPNHYWRLRGNTAKHRSAARSLMDLTADADVFCNLHRHFVYILKCGGSRLRETIVEGPPQADVSLNEEMVDDGADDDDNTSPMSSVASSLPPFERVLNVADFTKHFKSIDHKDKPMFTSLRHLFSVLPKKDFVELANHIICGDQVIIRGSDMVTVTSLLMVLKDLLPEGCCKIVGYSSAYQQPFVCNFLGLQVDVTLFDDVVNSQHHVIMDVVPPSNLPADHGSGDPLKQYKFMTSSKKQAASSQEAYPTVLYRLINILQNTSFSDNLVQQSIETLKREWLNKAKVLYAVSKTGKLDIKSKRKEKLTSLLQVLQCELVDIDILQFWFSAISKDYRSHLLQFVSN